MLKTTLSFTKKFLKPSGISSQLSIRPILPTTPGTPSQISVQSLSQPPLHYGFEKIFPFRTLSYGFATKKASSKDIKDSKADTTEKKKLPRDDDWKFNEVDPETSEQQAQSFFMKCRELLPEDAIEDLVGKIEAFKGKMMSGQKKRTDITTERAFLSSCMKLFEKHEATELMDFLLNINIFDLNPKMLSSTIFDFDSQFEISEKIGKFNEFSKTQIPKSNFVLDENAEKYDKHMSQFAEQGILKLLNKTKDMKFDKTNVPNPEKDSLDNEEFLPDVKIQPIENTDTQELAQQGENDAVDAEGIPVLDDNNFEGFSQIINDMDGEDAGRDADNIMSLLSENSVNQINKDEAKQGQKGEKFKERRKEEVKRKLAQEMSNIMLYKTQGKEEVIYVTQRGFETKEIPKTNWVYLYGLPYNIENEALLREDITNVFKRSIGEIGKIKIFQYKDYLNVTESNKKVNVYESLNDVFDPENLIASQSNSLTGGFDDSHEKMLQVVSTLPALNEKKKDMAKQRIRKTENILNNLKSKASKRLDKSYALIELKNYQEKEKALQPDVRIFGLHIAGRLCQIDDADYKLSLSCYNVHWGSPLKNFTEHINKIFEENNMMDLKVEMPKDFENRILTRFYVILRFNNFFNTLKAMQVLENAIFDRRPLRVHHLFGSLNLHQAVYSEVLDLETTRAKQERVNRYKLREISRISNLIEDEEPQEWNSVFSALAIDHDHLVEAELNEMNEMDRIQRLKQSDLDTAWYQSNSVSDDERYSVEIEPEHFETMYSKGR